MIRKNNKKVIPYNNDYEPVKVSKGDKVVFDYEVKKEVGQEVEITTPYKPFVDIKANGTQAQNTDKVPVLSVVGKAEIVDGNILGAGEYLSNQLVRDNSMNFDITSTVKNVLVNSIANNKYLLDLDFENNDSNIFINLENTGSYNVGQDYAMIQNSKESGHISKILSKDTNKNSIYFFRGNGTKCTIKNLKIRHLDDINCQDLTLDQLKAQRPDLFVPQPYHTTEKRIGIIFNDGSVDRLDSPLYAVNDIKDEYKTNGVVVRKTKIENDEVVALSQPIVELREPIAESRFDTINSIVNEDFTSSEEDTPSPSYPREIEHTTKIKRDDVEIDVDLYDNDYIVASRKVGKNIWDEEWELGYFNLSTGLPSSNNSISRSKNFIRVKNVQYYYKSNGVNHTIMFYKKDFSYITNSQFGSGDTIITIPNECEYIKFAYVGTTYNHDIMICLASEVDKTYEPYLKNKVWGYKVKGSVDLGTLNFNKRQVGNSYAWYVTNSSFAQDTRQYLVCSKYRDTNIYGIITNENQENNTIGMGFTGNYRTLVAIKDLSYSEVDEFRASLQGAILVYPLLQPQWIDLTDSLGSLLNDLTPNATQEFSVDNGQVKVSYYKSINWLPLYDKKGFVLLDKNDNILLYKGE